MIDKLAGIILTIIFLLFIYLFLYGCVQKQIDAKKMHQQYCWEKASQPKGIK